MCYGCYRALFSQARAVPLFAIASEGRIRKGRKEGEGILE